MAGQPGFFDLSDRYAALSAAGDPLERLAPVVDFEIFRGPLVAALRRRFRGKRGRPPFDPVLMFQILLLQALHSLSDEATEFQIKDRLSFQRFLGLGLDDTVPDATMVWLFRERLVNAKAIDKLFALRRCPQGSGLSRHGRADHRRHGRAGAQTAQYRSGESNDQGRPGAGGLEAGQDPIKGPRCPLVDQIQQGQGQRGADPKAAKPVDLAIPMFGYKNHIGIDKAHGLIRTWDASAANAHDGARLPVLISKDNTASGVWADTAYRSQKNEAFLASGMFTSHIHQKRKPRRPLPERIARADTRRSKIPAQVEHVFAGQKHRMGLVVRTIGIARATIKIGMANLAYNFQRLAWLEGRTAPA
jgi:transposase, IS5 family